MRDVKTKKRKRIESRLKKAEQYGGTIENPKNLGVPLIR